MGGVSMNAAEARVVPARSGGAPARKRRPRRGGHFALACARDGFVRPCEPDGPPLTLSVGAAADEVDDNGTMTRPDISGIAPFFIVTNVPDALSFYRDRLGFDVTFQGPNPEDVFFGIVQRGAAMIMLKAVGVEPQPNWRRDVQQGIARWDAYVHVPDPDALAAEFASRHVAFSQPLKDDDDGLRGFEIKDVDGYALFFGRPRR
jgi:catechol 2,3-dioxygenase-like lactoylglutathione lyase family enzyme